MIYKLKNILKFKNSSVGFTLIELIVVFAIIAILSTLGVASFVSYSRSQILNSSVSDLVSILNLAKSRAQSQVKPPICPAALEGYEFKLTPEDQDYQLNVRCSGTYPISAGELPRGINFGSFPTPTTTASIFFPVLTGGVQGFGTITITGYSQTKSISVDQAGNISQ